MHSPEVSGSCASLTAGTQFESARATGATHAVLSVSTGRTIEVTRDAEQAVIDFRGGPIDVDTLRAVRGLGENLERELASRALTDAEDVLLRVVSFVGDTHVGFNLERMVASRPTEAVVVPVDAAVDDVVRRGMTAVVAGIPAAAAEQLCASAVTALTPALIAAACQQNFVVSLRSTTERPREPSAQNYVGQGRCVL